MKHLFLFFLILIGSSVYAQRVVFDRNHFDIVNENGAVRLAAENTHNSYLNTINNRLNDINVNLSSVVLVQHMILNSLSQVDGALRHAIAVRQIGEICTDIYSESTELVEMAKDDPALLLFAEDVSRQLKSRGVRLAMEVSSFVLKEGENVLMDFEKRDGLLKKIALELRVMRALVFSMKKSMYWARVNGLLKTANPFRSYMNQDKWLVDEIIRKYNLLKP
ncbi:hypothetical protein [Pedobacter paludis]|uniref:Plasmid transfer protein n=1 Tax=Pedobacter paludis TaxID=2203212 RepID=A0A317F596_9SPHI|nr:hypothetical protein [Pedobacter paludis]PWS32666.1 hypothetical protein DF947_06235 [Pedobacter paludis]